MVTAEQPQSLLNEPMLSRKQCADQVNVSEAKIKAYARAGEFPEIRLGYRTIRIPVRYWHAYLERRYLAALAQTNRAVPA